MRDNDARQSARTMSHEGGALRCASSLRLDEQCPVVTSQLSQGFVITAEDLGHGGRRSGAAEGVVDLVRGIVRHASEVPEVSHRHLVVVDGLELEVPPAVVIRLLGRRVEELPSICVGSGVIGRCSGEGRGVLERVDAGERRGVELD
jgi:hypothetical protein